MLIGLLVSTSGVVTSFYADTPSGGTIVLMAIGAFTLVACATALRTRVTRTRRTVGPDLGTSRSLDAP
jgi:zinc transport system permease protein